MSDPEVRGRAWQARLVHPAWTAEPNAGHRALVDLERRGHGSTLLVTQNIDGLHQRGRASTRSRVVEIHGTMREVMCMTCDDRAPMERALDRVRAGEADPPCRSCGGILKSATISFGQNLVARGPRAGRAGRRGLRPLPGRRHDAEPCTRWRLPCPTRRAAAGARLVIVNAEPTPYDDHADAVLREPIGEVLPALVLIEAGRAWRNADPPARSLVRPAHVP